MKYIYIIIAAFALPFIMFVSCGDDEVGDNPAPVEITTSHMSDIQSFSWEKVAVVNDKYLVMSSYSTDDDFLTKKTAGIVLFTNPRVNFANPEGIYTISSVRFTATDCGYSWFELNNERGVENCGTVSISKSSAGHKVEIDIARMVDQEGDFAKNLSFSYDGQIMKSTMLEY